MNRMSRQGSASVVAKYLISTEEGVSGGTMMIWSTYKIYGLVARQTWYTNCHGCDESFSSIFHIKREYKDYTYFWPGDKYCWGCMVEKEKKYIRERIKDFSLPLYIHQLWITQPGYEYFIERLQGAVV